MKLKCPHCGNEDLEDILLGEWVPSQRRIHGIRDGKIYASPESNEIFEVAKDEHLFCGNCCEEFDKPEGLGVNIRDF
jgi:hypothetical protein